MRSISKYFHVSYVYIKYIKWSELYDMPVTYHMNLLSCVKGVCCDLWCCDVIMSWGVRVYRDFLRYAGYAKMWGVVTCHDVNASWAVGIYRDFLRYAGVCEVVRSCEELWRKRVMSCVNLLRLIAVRGVCNNAHNCMNLWRKRVMSYNYLSAPFWNFFVLCILHRILKFISWSAHKLRRNVKVPKKRRGKFFSSPRHR